MANRPKEPHAIDPRKLPSGRWKGRVQYWDPNTGQRKELTQTFATEREAKKWSREEEGRLRILKQPPSDQRLDHYLAQWRQNMVVGRKSEGTTDRYDYDIRHIVRYLGDRPLKTIQRSEVQRLYVQLAQDGLGNASINNVPVVLRSA